MGARGSTLIWLAAMVAIALLLPMGLGRLFTAWRENVQPQMPPVPRSDTVIDGSPEAAPAPPAPARVPNLRPIDRTMFAFRENAFRLGEKTDVRPQEPYRIDFDQRADAPPRVKLDLDRDGQFDEIWTYGSEVFREVSPADDGRWTERFRWDGMDWVAAE